MWPRKKLIIVALMAATVLLVGGIGTVAFAETGSADNTTSGKTLLARVAAILGIDQPTVEDAFAQAQSEMREEALDSYLQKLVDEGKITDVQAGEYKAWWQSRPDMAPFRQQLEEWQQARPDISLPGAFGSRGFRGGMMGGEEHGSMMGGGGRYFRGR